MRRSRLDVTRTILVLFICWPYLCGGPNFSSFSLSCIRIIPQHLTLFEPGCVVSFACIPLSLRLTGCARTFKSPWQRTTAAVGCFHSKTLSVLENVFKRLLLWIFYPICFFLTRLFNLNIKLQIYNALFRIRADCIQNLNLDSFHNVIGIINGNSDELRMKPNPPSPRRRYTTAVILTLKNVYKMPKEIICFVRIELKRQDDQSSNKKSLNVISFFI